MVVPGLRIMLVLGTALLAAGQVLPAPSADLPKPLGEPQLLKDGDSPINVEIGHAAPAVLDMNRDGKKDWLVGQFGGGKLRIYTNQGTDTEPRFKGFQYLACNGKEASVPFG